MVALTRVRGKECPHCHHPNRTIAGQQTCVSCHRSFTANPKWVTAIRCACGHETMVKSNFQDFDEIILCGSADCQRQLWPESAPPTPEPASSSASQSEDVIVDLSFDSAPQGGIASHKTTTIITVKKLWIGRLHDNCAAQKDWDEISLNLARQLTDEYISRVHAEIYLDNGRAFVRDLGSANGTRITGPNVKADGICLEENEPRELRVGDIINLDKDESVFRIEVVAIRASQKPNMPAPGHAI